MQNAARKLKGILPLTRTQLYSMMGPKRTLWMKSNTPPDDTTKLLVKSPWETLSTRTAMFADESLSQCAFYDSLAMV